MYKEREIEEDEQDKGEFCCLTMKECTDENDRDSTIRYYASTRDYFLSRFDKTSGRMNYCPWCGATLPKDLNDEWIDILVEEYGLESPCNWDRDKVPPEFNTDEWWKKRGL